MNIRTLALSFLAIDDAGASSLSHMDEGLPSLPRNQSLAQKEIEDYRRDGVIKVKGVFSSFQDEIKKLVDVLDNKLPLACHYQSTAFHTIVHKMLNVTNFGKQMDVICSDASTMFQEVEDMILTSSIGSIAAQLMGTSAVRLDHAPLMRTDASYPTPWHQDDAGAFLTNGTGLVVWIPFEPSTPQTDGLKFVAGSHKFPAKREMPLICAGSKLAFCVETLGKKQEEDPSNRVLTYDLEVGDALVFDKSTMHASTGLNMARRHNMQIRLIASGDESEGAYFKNMKGLSYLNHYGYHNDRANTFRFPQIYPSIIEDEYSQRVAYKTPKGFVAKLKKGFSLLRSSLDAIKVKDGIGILCPEGKCFRL